MSKTETKNLDCFDDTPTTVSDDDNAILTPLISEASPAVAPFTSPEKDRRKFDIVVLGATGFSGRIIAQELMAHAPNAVRWAVAGRSTDRLLSLVGRQRPDAPTVPVLVVDIVADPHALLNVVNSTRVVINAIGPYQRYGIVVAAACVECGTHYIDICGEPDYVHDLEVQLDETARSKGVLLLPSCGFDSVPSDLGNMLMIRAAHLQHPQSQVVRVSSYFQMLRTGCSGGSLQTIVNMGTAPWREVFASFFSVANTRSESYKRSTTRLGWRRRIPFRIPWPMYSAEVRGYTAPYSMSYVNTRIVQRANELSGVPAHYEESCGPFSFMRALGMCVAFVVLFIFVTLPPLRYILRRWIPPSGSGPSDALRRSGWFRIRFVAELDCGTTLRGMARYRHGDPCYNGTAVCASQAALCIISSSRNLTHKGGVLPTSIALGEAYLNKLVEQGMEFGILA
eukprot:PhM_4_TR4982/c0_g1_i1/m.14991